jgi:hypothetical protein
MGKHAEQCAAGHSPPYHPGALDLFTCAITSYDFVSLIWQRDWPSGDAAGTGRGDGGDSGRPSAVSAPGRRTVMNAWP